MSWFRSSRLRRSERSGAGEEGRDREVEAPSAPVREGPPRAELEGLALADLHALAREHGVERYRLLRREALIDRLAGDGDGGTAAVVVEVTEPQPESAPPEPEPAVTGDEQASGILELTREGSGFVRVNGLARSPEDPFVSRTQVRRVALRSGDELTGIVRPPRRGERHAAMVRVNEVNGQDADALDEHRPDFDELAIARPNGALRLERGRDDIAGRMIDLIAPLGRGQRGLVAGPPGSGASMLLREVARGLHGDDPHVIVVLCDVRPEEVLDWEDAAGLELHASTAEDSPEVQRRLGDLALERAKRLAESGRDVVLLLDSATRLARAHALGPGEGAEAPAADAPPDGAAVHAVKRWFATARNTRDAGSLTILAAVRADSESRLDQTVYEALADAANLELRLDAGLAAAGRRPAIDPTRSRTLQEDGVVDAERLRRLETLRGVARSLDAEEAWRFLTEKLRDSESNEQLLSEQG